MDFVPLLRADNVHFAFLRIHSYRATYLVCHAVAM